LDLRETLDLFFRKTCYHRNTSYRRTKRIKVVEKLYTYEFGSVQEVTELARKGSKLPRGPKLEAFTVLTILP
jgi:hypothetical protein